MDSDSELGLRRVYTVFVKWEDFDGKWETTKICHSLKEAKAWIAEISADKDMRDYVLQTGWKLEE